MSVFLSELHLATTWPNLTEGIVVDNEVYRWVCHWFTVFVVVHFKDIVLSILHHCSDSIAKL